MSILPIFLSITFSINNFYAMMSKRIFEGEIHLSIRGALAISVGKGTQWALRKFTNGGSSLPGKLAAKIDPAVLAQLSKDYEVAIITGTNGKTLTTSLTYHVLQQKFDRILTNPTGANMAQGIISTFLDPQPTKAGQKKMAILEVEIGRAHV